ncbi:MAG: hypothetical protein ABIJ45_09950 [Candidatus Zixiibacteriota bacterium]
MNKLFGKLKAELIENDRPDIDGLIKLINRNIDPPEKVTAETVYIRAMYIVSDQVNSYGGCFPPDEHPNLLEMLIDSPVMVGHRKDSLPIARNFHAEMVKRENSNWIKVYFYWLKEAENGEDLRKNIDGGIYKECSISFIFEFPECSICGEDVRECKHRPLAKYKTEDGSEIEAYFNYRRILKVLETSLVYRGSVRDTSITDQLIFGKEDESIGEHGTNNISQNDISDSTYRIWDIELLDTGNQYLIFPAFESIPVRLSKTEEGVNLYSLNGDRFESPVVIDFVNSLSLPDGEYDLEGRLIGYRGKERQSIAELLNFINGHSSTVRRIELKICGLRDGSNELINDLDGKTQFGMLNKLFKGHQELLIRSQVVFGYDLKEAIEKYSTRCGTEIVDCTTGKKYHHTIGKLIQLTIKQIEENGNGYQYLCTGLIDNHAVEVSNKVVDRKKHQVGDVIEVEISGLKLVDDKLQLNRPRISANLKSSLNIINSAFILYSNNKKKTAWHYYLNRLGDDELIFTIADSSGQTHYLINNYSRNLYENNRRFLADRLDISAMVANPKPSGCVEDCESDSKAMRLALSGQWRGRHIIRPVIIRGGSRFLFYKVGERAGV